MLKLNNDGLSIAYQYVADTKFAAADMVVLLKHFSFSYLRIRLKDHWFLVSIVITVNFNSTLMEEPIA